MDTPAAQLDPTQVCLEDGRLVCLGAPSPTRDRRADLHLLQARMHKGGQVDLFVVALWRAVLSIELVDGEPAPPWPAPTHAALSRHMETFSKGDRLAIVDCYARLMESNVVAPVLVSSRRRPRDVGDGRRRP